MSLPPPAARTSGDSGRQWKRRTLAALFVAGVVAFLLAGGPRYLDPATLQAHRDTLLAFAADHRAIAIVVAFVVYTAAVALALPGAAVLSLAMGLVFGRWLGGVLVVIAATTGATLLFLAARYLFANAARRRLGDWGRRLDAGFTAHAFSYLLFVRIVPAFPFFAVNLACALTSVPLPTYVLATFLGIVPGTFVFTSIGETLGHVASTRDLVSPSVLGALALLGAFALLPVAWQRWLRRRRGRQPGPSTRSGR